MGPITLTNGQARRFLLTKQGLMGEHKFSGKQGILDFVGQAGCIQYDPIDVCGRNAELVLQSRVRGFRKPMLYELLYTDRTLFDYFDKNLAILPMGDWPCLAREREINRWNGASRAQVDAIAGQVRDAIAQRGPLSSADLDYNDKVHWYWSDSKLSRAALESLYFRGELAIHHKKGTIKYYDLAQRCIPAELLAAPDPHPDTVEHLKWRVLRRVGAVGLLWNRASDAWLNLGELKAALRSRVFAELLDQEKLISLTVEGIGEPLYCLAADRALLEEAVGDRPPPAPPRCELLAPLDSLLWDRKLIKAVFGFDYKWEIYTPQVQRRYGYYVLPLLYGDSLAGRAEAVCNRKERVLTVKNIWYEPGVSRTQKLQRAVDGCIRRFMVFNDCKTMERADL